MSDQIQNYHGHITRFIYLKPGQDFAIALFRGCEGNTPAVQEFTIKGGGLATFQLKEKVEIRGTWVDDPKFGKQFKITNIFRPHPQSEREWQKYFEQNFPGVGETLAKKIVTYFGKNLEEVLKADPEKVRQVPGIKPKSADKFVAAWREDIPNQTWKLLCAGWGIGSSDGDRILKALGPAAAHIMQTNPYKAVLANRIGFVKADAIARSIGVQHDSLERAGAAILYTLGEFNKRGHVYTEKMELLTKTAEECHVRERYLQEALQVFSKGDRPHFVLDIIPEYESRGKIRPAKDIVYKKDHYDAEVAVARHLSRLQRGVPMMSSSLIEINATIAKAERDLKITLSPSQREAVRQGFTNRLFMITGRAGTGKTTTLKVLTKLAIDLNYSFVLTAPTGRAATRMTEVTGCQAVTLHRLLEYPPEGGEFCKRNATNPLGQHLIIVDEFSMVDLILFSKLLAAIPTGSSLVLVGHEDQLASVGAGCIIEDMLKSKVIPSIDLQKIFRQGQESLIVANAHRVLNKEPLVFYKQPPDSPAPYTYDNYLFSPKLMPHPKNPKQGIVDPGRTREMIRCLIQDRIPLRMPINPITDVQVVSPIKKGLLGTVEMNRFLQNALNPRPPEECVLIGDREYRIGDRVMVTKNDYKLEVSNGDIGFVHSFDQEEKTIVLNLYGRMIAYDFKSSDAIQLSYCATVHKLQGSEFPVVLFLILEEHRMMLQPKLLYTGLTRGKQLAVLIAEESALSKARGITQTRWTFDQKRNSRLIARILQARVPKNGVAA